MKTFLALSICCMVSALAKPFESVSEQVVRVNKVSSEFKVLGVPNFIYRDENGYEQEGLLLPDSINKDLLLTYLGHDEEQKQGYGETENIEVARKTRSINRNEDETEGSGSRVEVVRSFRDEILSESSEKDDNNSIKENEDNSDEQEEDTNSSEVSKVEHPQTVISQEPNSSGDGELEVTEKWGSTQPPAGGKGRSKQKVHPVKSCNLRCSAEDFTLVTTPTVVRPELDEDLGLVCTASFKRGELERVEAEFEWVFTPASGTTCSIGSSSTTYCDDSYAFSTRRSFNESMFRSELNLDEVKAEHLGIYHCVFRAFCCINNEDVGIVRVETVSELIDPLKGDTSHILVGCVVALLFGLIFWTVYKKKDELCSKQEERSKAQYELVDVNPKKEELNGISVDGKLRWTGEEIGDDLKAG